MKTDSREMDRFTGPMFRRGLLPALISSVGLGISDVADAVVLGQRMGETGLAAISLALPVFMVINLVMHSFGSGGSIRYSRLLGEGNPKEAVKSFSFVIETALILGIVMALAGDFLIHPILSILGASRENIQLYEASRIYVEVIISGIPLFFGSYILNYYLRSDGCQKLASFGFTVGNLSDLFLNILLVLVFDLGAAGAAWSTLTGQAVAICIYLWSLRRGEREGLLAFRPAFPRLKEIYTCFRLGLSTSSQYVFQMVFLLIANRMLMKGNSLFSYWKLLPFWMDLLDTGLITRRLFGPLLNDPPGKLPVGGDSGCRLVDALPGSFFMLRRDRLPEGTVHSLFDKNIFLYYEEKVLGRNLKGLGLKTVLVTDASYVHAHSVSIDKSVGKIVGKQKLLHKSKLYYYKKYLHAGPVRMAFARAFLGVVLAEVWVLTEILGLRW